jgi:hypothetical protein
MKSKILIYLFFLISGLVQSQDFARNTNIIRLPEHQQEVLTVFNDIESGFTSGNVALFSKYFATETFLSLNTGIVGYYSSNQSYYVLQNFFNLNKPISFKYTNSVAGTNPYATGIFNYESKSRRETAQVFISLDSSGKVWKISQITIK